MIAILIVAILAVAVTPGYVRAIERAKWSEANAAAGSIRSAILAYAADVGVDDAQDLVGKKLNDHSTQSALGFGPYDLDGTYFAPGDYTISAVNSKGVAAITATGGSKPESPEGSYKLELGGDWVKQ